jgi:hypothetical protein
MHLLQIPNAYSTMLFEENTASPDLIGLPKMVIFPTCLECIVAPGLPSHAVTFSQNVHGDSANSPFAQ